MSNQKNSSSLVFNILIITFGIVGLGLIAGSIAAFIHAKNFNKNAKPTEATIVEIKSYTEHYYVGGKKKLRTSHDVYVDYEAEGDSYTYVPLGYYTSNMHKGDKITVYYDPANTSYIVAEGALSLLTILLGVMGAVFSLVSILFIVLKKKLASGLSANARNNATISIGANSNASYGALNYNYNNYNQSNSSQYNPQSYNHQNTYNGSYNSQEFGRNDEHTDSHDGYYLNGEYHK